MTYYKAEIFLSTETLLDDGSYDPNSYQDCGIIDTIKAPTLEKVFEKLKRQYDLSKFEIVEFDDEECFLEGNFQGEHDYRTPKSEQVPFMENFQIRIFRCTDNPITKKQLRKLMGVKS